MKVSALGRVFISPVYNRDLAERKLEVVSVSQPSEYGKSRSASLPPFKFECIGQVQQDTFFREFSNSIGDRPWFAECSLSRL